MTDNLVHEIEPPQWTEYLGDRSLGQEIVIYVFIHGNKGWKVFRGRIMPFLEEPTAEGVHVREHKRSVVVRIISSPPVRDRCLWGNGAERRMIALGSHSSVEPGI